MKQVVQSIGDGSLRIVEVPTPTCGPAEVLVSTTRSLLSTDAEKAVRELASSSLIDKAKVRLDLVRQVLKKARTEGLRNTVQAVHTRLDEAIPLGYSATGVVVEEARVVSLLADRRRFKPIPAQVLAGMRMADTRSAWRSDDCVAVRVELARR